MGDAERLTSLVAQLSPEHVAEVLQFAEHLAKRTQAPGHKAEPALAWLNALPEEDEQLAEGEWASHLSALQEIEGGAPAIPLDEVERAFGLAT